MTKIAGRRLKAKCRRIAWKFVEENKVEALTWYIFNLVRKEKLHGK